MLGLPRAMVGRLVRRRRERLENYARNLPSLRRSLGEAMKREGDIVEVIAPERQPTNENLNADCASVCDQLEGHWEGEVETIVIMARRRGNNPPTYSHATTMENQPRLRAILQDLARRELRLVKRGGLVRPPPLLTKPGGGEA